MSAPSKRKQAEERRRQQEQEKRKLNKRHSTRSYKEKQETKALEKAIAAGAPASGSNPLAINTPLEPGQYAGARTFEELPISLYTKEGLKQAHYITLTAIQRAALPHALCGRDVLGAAKTGSGKTLAFLIPIVEKLYRLQWTRLDGLGALVLTPTRELALQIFEELKKVGRRHEMSAGLLIGGNNVKEEAQLVNSMNILIATPGRLLQHMDETPGFDASNLQVLVLDEADRILDMGFAATLDAIVTNLPQRRQTMLFSATQTKSVRDLARLSLQDPEYLAVHAEAEAPTPLKLQQAIMVVGLHEKMDVLWSFLKAHLRNKTILFLSTCKQVRFVFEALRKLRPGVPLRCLHGNMKQPKRLAVFYEFCKAESMVLVATDIAARGLDFPTVDWVVQGDCPEDVAAYIHRVGRTARYTSAGRALLLLTPSEREGMLRQLSDAKVPYKLLKQNPAKLQPVGPALQALLSKSAELKDYAQRALVAYLRSVYLQPNKEVFDVTALPIAEFAQSLGLLAPPKLRFLKRVGKKVVADMELGGFHEEEEAGEGQQEGQQGKQQERERQEEQQVEDAMQQGESEEEQPEEEDGSDVGFGKDEEEGQQRLAGAKRKRAERQQQVQEEGEEEQQEREGGMDEGDDMPARLSERKRSAATASTSGARLASTTADAGDDDDDGFLVVKRHNVFDSDQAPAAGDHAIDSGGAGATAVAAAAAAAAPKKRKKQKIKAGAVSGSRVVFDEEGNALDPLAALAANGELGPEDAPDAGDREPGSMHVVADAPDERFAAVSRAMRARDAVDKKRAAELRRELRAAKKAKRKAREQGDMQPGGVALGGASDDEQEDGSDHSDVVSSDDEDAGPSTKAPGQPDAAYVGMARKQPSKEQHGKQQQQQQQQQPLQKGRMRGVEGLSLAEQEALALQLLSRRR